MIWPETSQEIYDTYVAHMVRIDCIFIMPLVWIGSLLQVPEVDIK